MHGALEVTQELVTVYVVHALLCGVFISTDQRVYLRTREKVRKKREKCEKDIIPDFYDHCYYFGNNTTAEMSERHEIISGKQIYYI